MSCFSVAWANIHKLMMMAIIGMVIPKGILKGRSLSAHFLRNTITAIQVGKYWVKRDTALMAAKVAKLPLQASKMLITAVTTEATHGVPHAVRFANTDGNMPSSAKDVHTRGPMKASAMLIPPMESKLPAGV